MVVHRVVDQVWPTVRTDGPALCRYAPNAPRAVPRRCSSPLYSSGSSGSAPSVPLGLQLRVGLLEGVGDVLEEDQPEHDVLVLGGVHAAAQRVGHLPELGLVTGGDAVLGGHGAFTSGRSVRVGSASRPDGIASSRWTGSLAVGTRASVPLPELVGQDPQERVRLHPVHVVRALELVEHAD